MFVRVQAALELLFKHFAIYAAIALTMAWPALLLWFHLYDQDLFGPNMSTAAMFSCAFLLDALQLTAITIATARFVSGEPVTYNSLLFNSLRYWPRILLVALAANAVIFIGFLCFIVPGLIIAARLSLVVPVLLVEGRSPVETLKRSWRLTDGWALEIFAVTVLVRVAASMPQSLHTIIAGDLGPAGHYAWLAFSALFTLPLPIIMVLYYLDCRDVGEALDPDAAPVPPELPGEEEEYEEDEEDEENEEEQELEEEVLEDAAADDLLPGEDRHAPGTDDDEL